MDRICLLSVPGQAEQIIAHLGRYIIREDVELADSTGKDTWAIIVGPAAEHLFASLPEVKGELPTEPYQHITCQIEGRECLVRVFHYYGQEDLSCAQKALDQLPKSLSCR